MQSFSETCRSFAIGHSLTADEENGGSQSKKSRAARSRLDSTPPLLCAAEARRGAANC
jgi:hypothetical protein